MSSRKSEDQPDTILTKISEEVCKAVHLLQLGTASGPDQIQPEHLRYGGSPLAYYLSILFNQIVNTEYIFPRALNRVWSSPYQSLWTKIHQIIVVSPYSLRKSFFCNSWTQTSMTTFTHFKGVSNRMLAAFTRPLCSRKPYSTWETKRKKRMLPYLMCRKLLTLYGTTVSFTSYIPMVSTTTPGVSWGSGINPVPAQCCRMASNLTPSTSNKG